MPIDVCYIVECILEAFFPYYVSDRLPCGFDLHAVSHTLWQWAVTCRKHCFLRGVCCLFFCIHYLKQKIHARTVSENTFGDNVHTLLEQLWALLVIKRGTVWLITTRPAKRPPKCADKFSWTWILVGSKANFGDLGTQKAWAGPGSEPPEDNQELEGCAGRQRHRKTRLGELVSEKKLTCVYL